MIYWYTGQPGHGKTLCAIARALEFKEQGRIVYVCNVRGFDYDKTGTLKMTPEDFINWMAFLPDGAVCLVDECYEHGMLPKRSPAQKVPEHVERLATHRHRGLDFIFVCQSPDKQADGFTHDLIERHIHVRRRFGTQFQHLREFDRFERNPEKATPLLIKRQRLPKKVFGLYKSTELDTTERRVPWYFIAFALGVPLSLGLMYYTFGGMGERLGGNAKAAEPVGITGANVAQATVAPGSARAPATPIDFIQRFVPRVATQPWSAPAYDDHAVSGEAPRLFCMSAAHGEDVNGELKRASCTCLTEQGTRYLLPVRYCASIARNGQYEPYYTERSTEGMGGRDLYQKYAEKLQAARGEQIKIEGGQAHAYGDVAVPSAPGAAAGASQ